MDIISILGRIGSGFAVKVAAIGAAIYVASYGMIALCDALERVSQVLPK
jgi:hypothetical protein